MHIPKTAGTTLRNVLEERFEPRQIMPSDWEVKFRWRGHYPTIPKLLKIRRSRWEKARFLRGHYPWQVSERFPQKPVLLTLLREPIARSVSQLRHVQRSAPWAAGLGLEEILHQDGYIYSNLNNVQTKMLGMRFPLDNEHEWPEDISHPVAVDDPMFEQALNTLQTFDFFGLQERFDESMAMMFRVLGWPLPTGFKRDNDSGNALPASERVVEILTSANQHDLRLYEHASAIFEQRLADYQ